MIPDYQSLMLPLLKTLDDGNEHRLRDSYVPLADTFGLSHEDRATLLASGRAPVFRSRVNWARAYLKQAGLVDSATRGSLHITPRGREVLADAPSQLTNDYLNRYPEFRDFRARSRQLAGPKPDPDPEGGATSAEQSATPEEQMEQSWRILREQLADELLLTVKAATPAFFERLVVELLVRMGYGGSDPDAGSVVGMSGDGGIDGVINEDQLGLDVVYIQAKRWDRTVGRPDVQAFSGSLAGRRAAKGVMITTSAFSADARSYVEQIQQRIVLLDGKALVKLMLDHQVGVATTRSYPVQRLDLDYFDED